MAIQAIKKNEEYHEVLDSLEARNFFGQLTCNFQNGLIESCRISETLTKKELRERKKDLIGRESIKEVEQLMLDKSRTKVLVRKTDG